MNRGFIEAIERQSYLCQRIQLPTANRRGLIEAALAAQSRNSRSVIIRGECCGLIEAIARIERRYPRRYAVASLKRLRGSRIAYLS